jgi:hypothetical protein
MWKTLTIACILLILAASAAAPANLPDESQQTMMSATIFEQAEIVVPDDIWFDVTDVTQVSNIWGPQMSITNISLAPGNALRVEVKADAEDFTPPPGGSVAWVAGDVSWSANSWTGGTGFAGTLSSAAYTVVAESGANPTELSCSNMAWSLAAKPGCDRAGIHELYATWRVTSFAP